MNPYVDARTGVRYNKLGITDRKQLAEVEYRLTNLRSAELVASPITGTFDLDHLRRIHRHVFQDVYEWAGELRTINFSKRDPAEPHWKSVFARHAQIPAIADSIERDLQAWDHLQGLAPAGFIGKLTATYVKLNHMHPFPEGNGRSTQLFIRQLALEAGYRVDFGQVDRHAWNRAAARSMPQTNAGNTAFRRPEDTRPILAVFSHIVTPTHEKQRELDTLAGKTPARRDLGPER